MVPPSRFLNLLLLDLAEWGAHPKGPYDPDLRRRGLRGALGDAGDLDFLRTPAGKIPNLGEERLSW